jgi:uracil-DNA glycosylase
MNIYRELQDDLGIEPAAHGDLTRWVESGVLLLNRVLTVQSGRAGSDRGMGWETLTARALEALARRGGPLVAILWGNDAQTASALLGDVPIIASAHPSPLSARKGFFGSRPFSRANELLLQQGGQPIDWRV